MKYFLLPFFSVVLFISCKPSTPATEEAAMTPAADTSVSTIVNIPGLTRLWDTDKTLTTAESVLYDKANDVLYVSCINGVPPDKKDKDGYISRVGLDGKIKDLKWVTGFSAPKGMGQSGNTLYVTDIDRLVSIDIPTGKINNTWKVDGATFLNDVYVTSAGTVYFTDSNTSTIYTLANGKVVTVHADATLGGTNGILVEENTIYLAGSMSGNVYRMDMTTKAVEKIATDVPGGDGIVRYGDDLLVSNWNGQVYHVTMDGEVTLLLDSQEAKLNAADIEVIADQNILLVPTFFGNGVTAYQLAENK
ncbi:MAG: SMP-30/gluconolactonase/LRE family protein [Saprospiraceae bacterium]|nr:SMP-30/gluconolactonase/LRE family protein [Saprospiraceae bacterium]